jgi:hypothetical protein
MRMYPQNLALNVASKGFSISVFNRSYDKTQAAVKRAEKEGGPAGFGNKLGRASDVAGGTRCLLGEQTVASC